jgi:hypothetical protein
MQPNARSRRAQRLVLHPDGKACSSHPSSNAADIHADHLVILADFPLFSLRSTRSKDALEKAICNWLSTEEKRDLASSTSIAWQVSLAHDCSWRPVRSSRILSLTFSFALLSFAQKIEFQTSIALTIGIPHCSNWQVRSLKNVHLLCLPPLLTGPDPSFLSLFQNWGERWARRTKFRSSLRPFHYRPRRFRSCVLITRRSSSLFSLLDAAVKYYAEKLQIECQNSLAPYSFVSRISTFSFLLTISH